MRWLVVLLLLLSGRAEAWTHGAAAPGNFVINITYDTASNTVACAANGAISFKADVTNAVAQMMSAVTSNVHLNIQFGCDSINNANDTSFQGGAESVANTDFFNGYSYTQVTGYLAAVGAGSSIPADNGYLATLPTPTAWAAAYPCCATNQVLYTATARLYNTGTIAPSTIDCWVGYGSLMPTGLGVGAMLHEISECMGRTQQNITTVFAIFTSTGNWYPTGAVTTAHYFSTNGGVTDVADFSVASNADFADFCGTGCTHGQLDPFNAFLAAGTPQSLTTIDKRFLDILGYTIH